jgi:hypothetical protein
MQHGKLFLECRLIMLNYCFRQPDKLTNLALFAVRRQSMLSDNAALKAQSSKMPNNLQPFGDYPKLAVQFGQLQNREPNRQNSDEDDLNTTNSNDPENT